MNTTPGENIYKNLREIELYLGALDDGSFPSSLEIDLALAKLREVYEDVIAVKRLREGGGYQDRDVPVVKDKPAEPKIETKKQAAEKQVSPGPVDVQIPVEIAAQEKEVQAIATAPVPREVSPTKEEPGSAQELTSQIVEIDQPSKKEDSGPLVKKQKEIERTIIAEKFQGSQVFMNEVVAQVQNRPDLSSRLQSKPIKNIPAAIGINDKFLFIKELFKGDAETYAETIKILDLAPSFNDAFNYLDARFGWDPDDLVVQKLLDLVRRRHIG